MIDAGVPETAAEDNARALNLFAQGDADYVTDDVPEILGPAGAYLRTVRHRPRRRLLVKLRQQSRGRSRVRQAGRHSEVPARHCGGLRACPRRPRVADQRDPRR
jgi:primosomal protein N'